MGFCQRGFIDEACRNFRFAQIGFKWRREKDNFNFLVTSLNVHPSRAGKNGRLLLNADDRPSTLFFFFFFFRSNGSRVPSTWSCRGWFFCFFGDEQQHHTRYLSVSFRPSSISSEAPQKEKFLLLLFYSAWNKTRKREREREEAPQSRRLKAPAVLKRRRTGILLHTHTHTQ